MKNSVYPEQCFSSQCGLCFSCTNALHPTPVKHETKENDTSQPKTRSYSEVIGKFEKPRITEMGETYVRTLLKLNAREERFDCATADEKYFGIIPTKYKADESHAQSSLYVRQETPHTLVCDMPLCKAIYDSTPDYTRNRYYPQFPIYSRDLRPDVKQDVSCNLCHTCISKIGEPRN